MQSTIAQCGSPTDWCGRVYPFHEAWAREIADRTGSGRLVSIEAGHEIYLEELDRVVEELQVLIDDARSSGIGTPLNYVALGDSLLYALESDCDGCTSAATIYGEQMSSDLGVPVDVHNLTMHNSLTSGGLRQYLEHGAEIGRDAEDVLEAVAEADAVSVTIGFNDISELPSGEPTFLLDNMRSNLDAILARIKMLRAGEPTNPSSPRSTTTAARHGPRSLRRRTRSSATSPRNTTRSVSISTAHSTALTARPVQSSRAISAPIEPIRSQLGMEVIAEALAAAGYGPLD